MIKTSSDMVKVTINAKENGPLIVETDGKRLHYVDALHPKTNQTVMAHIQNLVSKQMHQKSKFVIR